MYGHVGVSGWSDARRVCLQVARRYCGGDPAEAEDIVQDALLRAWRHAATLGDPGRQQAWLATITRNEALRHHARRKPEPVATTDGGDGADDPRVAATADRADVQSALARLPKADRRLLHLRYVEDLTNETIAGLLGMPVGTVKTHLHRARSKLRMAHGHGGYAATVAAGSGRAVSPQAAPSHSRP